MKQLWNKKSALLWIGFALLVAMPFLIIYQRPPSVPQVDNTINPYPEPKDPAALHIQKASEHYFYREFEKAAENYRKAIAIYEERRDTHRVATTYNSLGDLYVWAGETEEAHKNYLLAAEQHAKIVDALGQADSLKKLASMYMKLENYPEAEEWYTQSLGLLTQSKPNRVLGSVHEGMGHLYWKSDRLPQALASFTQARDTFAALNYHLGVKHMTGVIDRLKRAQNHLPEPPVFQEPMSPPAY